MTADEAAGGSGGTEEGAGSTRRPGAEEGAAKEDAPPRSFAQQFAALPTQQQVAKVEAFARMDERQMRELLPSLDEQACTSIAAVRQAMGMVEMMK